MGDALARAGVVPSHCLRERSAELVTDRGEELGFALIEPLQLGGFLGGDDLHMCQPASEPAALVPQGGDGGKSPQHRPVLA